MIKLKLTDLKLVKKEFQLGNRYLYVTREKDPEHQKFAIIDKIETGGKIFIKEYNIREDYKRDFNNETLFKNWRFGISTFTLLNQGEANKHLKNVIAMELIQ